MIYHLRLISHRLLRYAYLGIMVILLISCQQQEQLVERKRISSPSREFEAVIVEWPTNATADFLSGLAVVERGKPIQADRMLVTGSSLIGDGVHWEDDQTVVVSYSRDGQIYSFRNRWYPADAMEGKSKRFVEVVLIRH